MRIDKFLKVSRLIKRRTVANEACDAGRVLVNGKAVKASYEVKKGDVLELLFGQRTVKAEVLTSRRPPRKKKQKNCFVICEPVLTAKAASPVTQAAHFYVRAEIEKTRGVE